MTYKAEAAGITVVLVDEAYTSQTCPGTLPDGTACLHCYKPKGRVYRCPACGFTAHRDGVGGSQPALAALHGRARPCAAGARDVSLPLLETQTGQA